MPRMEEDLSVYHSPVSSFLESGESSLYVLSRDQIEFYKVNGYLTGLSMLSEVQTEWLRRELRELSDISHPLHHLFYEFHSNESADPSTILLHALGAWRIAPGFHDVLWHSGFTTRASQLLGGAVRFWHDQIFSKPARHGGVVAWHQDYSYWTRTRPLAHVTCWIGLDASTRENGCVHYVPGSHLWPDLPITGLAGDMDAIYAVLDESQKKAFNPVPIELNTGQCSFHHPRTIHGSFANTSDQPRRATVINAFLDGVLSNSNEPLLEGVPPITIGEKMGGQFFPLLKGNS
jgi:hypothetical protein